MGTLGLDSRTSDAKTSELRDALGLEDVINKQHVTFATVKSA